MVAPTGDPELDHLLAIHPGFSVTESGTGFWQDRWHREVRVGDLSADWAGLVELCDNNPMVCADSFSVPGPFSTLALIALGPFIRAGILEGTPRLEFRGEGENPAPWLSAWGWDGPLEWVASPSLDESWSVSAHLDSSGSWEDVEELMDESYSRSFFVRRDPGKILPGDPHAHYQITARPGGFSIEVRAWRHGKLGAAQVMHAMNVMCGFEESVPFS